jgi:diaminohydroxyphosphoribosylaminopyrimidine deaminase / 5-amino-6-(5-phosphoribosylamino)uracil reductase
MDARFMKHALSLARRGRKMVRPNPMVGCVIVRDGSIVGQGYHEYFGGPHAEVNALKEAGSRAKGSALYVTLEPCDHSGKTPPCTRAIIAAGVTRVVVATTDPNPKVRGKGILRLRRNSIRVSSGVLGAENRSLNREYVALRRGPGCVIAKAAMTLDGKIAARGGDSKWITSKQARSFAHRTRATVDAVVVGRGTVQRDNPSLTSHGLGKNPVRVVIDPHLKLSPASKVFNRDAPTIIVHATKADQHRLEKFKKKRILAVRLPMYRGKIPFNLIIRKLQDYGLRRILIEGGGETIAAAFEANVVTDVMFFIAPKILGGRDARTPVEGPGASALPYATMLTKLKARSVGPDILLTARVRARKNREGD